MNGFSSLLSSYRPFKALSKAFKASFKALLIAFKRPWGRGKLGHEFYVFSLVVFLLFFW